MEGKKEAEKSHLFAFEKKKKIQKFRDFFFTD